MDYRELQAVLDGMGAGIGAAEAHGWLCGALCARTGFEPADWLRELAQSTQAVTAAEHAAATLESVHRQTLEALSSPEFVFEPLLPGEDAGLEERVTALAAWCGGFLYGVGTGGARPETGDVGEILRDLAEIARARLEPGRIDDDGESDLAELTEFVRAGAQLAFDELAPARAHGTPVGLALH